MEAHESVSLGSTETKPASRLWFWIAVAAGLAVVALITLGIVSTFVLPNIVKKLEFASRSKAIADVRAIDSALIEFALANGGKFPDSLALLVVPDVNGKSFLDSTKLPRDPWGREYQYAVPAPGHPRPRVYSLGRDGMPGGEGDDADVDVASDSASHR
jgi:general secretion pathway protein G